ncbi:MAG TPA: lytic transglycosylase domain-containing protein [Polyangiaceae bacterium]|nr:lytic transglycosylase domain-containing protein [Polyangiaceae bacterium]
MRPSRLLATGLLALVPGVAAADIYQYTDADGVVHLVNSAPKGVNARLLVRGGNAPRAGAPIVAPSDHDPARFSRYDEWIRQAATLYQIPEQLVRAVIKVESDYDPRAVSVSGARGLMQLMPDTAERMQVRDIDDPRENIFGGVRLLRILANAFNGDLSLTIAAYNAGPDAVMRYSGIPPFEQTRNYVVKVTSFYRRYRSIPDVVEASLAK